MENGWWLTSIPLKNMSSSIGMIIPNIWKNTSHVPNHQTDDFVSDIFFARFFLSLQSIAIALVSELPAGFQVVILRAPALAMKKNFCHCQQTWDLRDFLLLEPGKKSWFHWDSFKKWWKMTLKPPRGKINCWESPNLKHISTCFNIVLTYYGESHYYPIITLSHYHPMNPSILWIPH